MSTLTAQTTLTTGQRLEILQGDITAETVDAIVNAANAQLVHGGGVAGAIVRKGGEAIQEESDCWVKQHGPVPHAEPAITGPGRLPCKYLIHAVGPYWGQGDEDRRLTEAIHGSLKRADEYKLHSIAFPAISTGIFGFPKDRAAAIIFTTIQAYFKDKSASSLQVVRIVIIDKPTLDVFIQQFELFLRANL